MPIYIPSEGKNSQVPTHLTRISIPHVSISTDSTNKIIKGKVLFKGPLSKTAPGSFVLKTVIQEDAVSENSSINTFLYGVLAKDFSHSVSLEDVVVVSGFTVGKSPTAKSDKRHPFNLLLTSDQACIYVAHQQPPPDPGPSSASNRSSSLTAKPPKHTYVKLSDLKAEELVNVYGVVVFFKQPFKSYGTDYCSSLKITDESNQKIVCTIFCREMDDHPKIFQNGDIIRLHRVKAKWFNGSMTLSSNVGFSVVTFDGAVGGAVEPRSSRKFFSFDEHDRRRVEELRSWAVSQDVCSTVSAAVPLSGVQPKVYFDLTCQLLAKAPIDTTCMLLRVWDGTKCPYTQSDVTIDPDTIEGPASFSGTKKSFIANILVFDNHVVCAKQLKIGAFLRIYNLRAVFESVKEPGLLRMDTDHLVFQLNGGTSFGKGIRVLPESSPDVQKLKRSFESFSEDEPSDSEMLEIWSTPPEFLNDGAVETRTERSCSHQIQPMTLSQLKQSQPKGEYHVRAQLRSYQPHRLHQSLKLFCSNCSSMQEIPNEEVLSGIFSAAFQDSTPCRHPPWILSGHVSLPEDVAQSPKKSMDVLASSRLLKKENPKEFIFLQGFSLEETCMLAAHYENIVPLTSSGGDLDLLDLSAPFLFRGKKRYYGCKRCSEASLRNMKAVGAVVDEKFLAEDLGIQLLQYVLLMRLKLQDSTDTLDVFLWKDAEKFFGVSAEDVSATEEAQERVQKVMDLLCPPEDSQDQRPWLDLCLMAYAVEDEPGQSQTCYQIINTTIITPSTTQSGPD
uniref:Protection of telomeres protein 1 n=1 Tax=Nothobranchius furzeri TaxID=105023 RepID=A0A1A8VK00_NOTFU